MNAVGYYHIIIELVMFGLLKLYSYIMSNSNNNQFNLCNFKCKTIIPKTNR